MNIYIIEIQHLTFHDFETQTYIHYFLSQEDLDKVYNAIKRNLLFHNYNEEDNGIFKSKTAICLISKDKSKIYDSEETIKKIANSYFEFLMF